MTPTRQIVLAITVIALIAAAVAVFKSPPTQKTDLVIAPVAGPSR
jgi:hypothetical protein